MAHNSDEIIGAAFGKLTVIAESNQKDTEGRTLYTCRCECGETKLVAANRLRSGSVKSCGCTRKAAHKAIGGSKERNGWGAEEESQRVRKIYTRASGVYQRGKFWVAQMKFDGRTVHILSTPNREDAIAARQEIVQMRLELGNDATIDYIERTKAARKEARREMMHQFGGFPTREQMEQMKKL